MNGKKKGIKIWTLNATSELLSGHERGIIRALKQLKKEGGFEFIEFGDRGKYNKSQPKIDATHKEFQNNKAFKSNLLPDDEYFIPIAAKCLGKYLYAKEEELRKTGKSGEADKLRKIKEYYESQWKIKTEKKYYRQFWESQSGPFNYGRMLTKGYTGYYEILERESGNGTWDNILIGYSQGGMVALFLAWLDENVFGGAANIRAVLTLQSPNYGSPLANPENAESIIPAAIELIVAFFSVYRTDSRQSGELISQMMRAVSFKHQDNQRKNNNKNQCLYLYDLILLLLNIYEKRKEHIKGIINKALFKFGLKMLRTIIKWSGGLADDPCNAFFDLDITRLAEANSVMHKIHYEPPKTIKYGSVLSAFNVIRITTSCKPLDCLIRFILNHTHVLDRNIMQNLDEIGRLFKETVMNEKIPKKKSLSDAWKEIKKRIRIFRNGNKLHGEYLLHPRAHDFVIPSSYQYVAGTEQDNCILKNAVNPRASHISGKSTKYEGGRKNLRLIKKFLRRLSNTKARYIRKNKK